MSSPSVSAAITAAGRLVRDRPGQILPAYLLAASVAAVARVPVFLAFGGAVAVLAATGRVEPILRAAADAQRGDDPTGVPPGTGEAVGSAITPGVVGLVLLGGLTALLVGLVVRPVAIAVTQSTVWAAIDGDEKPLVRGVAGAGRWQTFLGVLLLRLAAAILLVGVPAAATAGLAAVSTPLGLVGGLLTLAGGVGFLLVSAALAFAGPAAVVDEAGTIDAVRASVGFLRRNLGTAVVFLVVAAGAFLAAGVAAGLASAVGVGRVGGLFVPLVVAPLVDTIATGLYAGVSAPDSRPTDDPADADPPTTVTAASETEADNRSTAADTETDDVPPPEPSDATESAGTDRHGPDPATATADDPAVSSLEPPESRPTVVSRSRDGPTGVARLVAVLRDGLRALGGQLHRHPLAVAGGFLAFVLGGAGGWGITARFGIRFASPTDPGAVFGTVPIGTFLNIAANNWLVAVSGVYGGVAFALPTVVAALFNGAVVGALAGVFDPLAFAALVAPHGVIEVPTLAIAWGIGIHLGLVGFRAVRGRVDAAHVARELRRAGRALVGVAVLLVVAAAIEAFLTPRIAALVV